MKIKGENMEKYVIKTAFKMGEADPKYGQTWYCTVEEVPVPIMFNLMSGSVQELDRISFETQELHKFKSGKNQGKEYRRLKKVKVEEHAPRLVEPANNSSIEERLKKLEEAVFGKEEVENRNDDSAQSETDDDEQINLDDIPF